MLDLLRAASASHVRGQRLEAVRVFVSLVLAVAGLLAAFNDAAAVPVSVAGAIWAIAYVTGFNPWAKNEARRGATVQEMLDVDLFDLNWNHTAAGQRLPPHEISQLVHKFTPGRGRVDRLRDWYVDTEGGPQPYDVLICQQQNLGWDARLRRRWARVLLGAVITWTLLGLLIGYLAELTVAQTVTRWYLPAAAALLLGLDGYRTQRDLAAERERIIPLVQAEIDTAQLPPLPPAEQQRLGKTMREVQDVILATRKQTVRVPQWFYARFRDADEQDFQTNAKHLRNKLTKS
jgi:SMODS-associating 4TM effector domain